MGNPFDKGSLNCGSSTDYRFFLPGISLIEKHMGRSAPRLHWLANKTRPPTQCHALSLNWITLHLRLG